MNGTIQAFFERLAKRGYEPLLHSVSGTIREFPYARFSAWSRSVTTCLLIPPYPQCLDDLNCSTSRDAGDALMLSDGGGWIQWREKTLCFKDVCCSLDSRNGKGCVVQISAL
jgi:hypothetical protein